MKPHFETAGRQTVQIRSELGSGAIGICIAVDVDEDIAETPHLYAEVRAAVDNLHADMTRRMVRLLMHRGVMS